MNTTTAGPPEQNKWKDPKRWLWLFSPFLPILGIISIQRAYALESSLAFWALPLAAFVAIPLIDLIVGSDTDNPPDHAIPELENTKYYRYIVYAYLPTQFIATIFGTWVAVSVELHWWDMLGLIISVGLVNGIGINTAHELGHRTEKLERWLSKVALSPVAYGHFYVEHNRGHHKNVATPEDPASSRLGESFYAFLPRTMIGSLISAWSLEKTRLQRKNKSVWSIENDNLQAWSMTLALFASLTLWLGWPALLFLLAQAFYGASLLEVINYTEHYGLMRQFNHKAGRYVRCQPEHSWNSNNIVTNLFLYQLQRHSDHHANPTRRYQALRYFVNSPQLPAGYATMVVYAYLPFLWFRIMDARVLSHYEGDLSLANVHPPKQDKLSKKWSQTRA